MDTEYISLKRFSYNSAEYITCGQCGITTVYRDARAAGWGYHWPYAHLRSTGYWCGACLALNDLTTKVRK